MTDQKRTLALSTRQWRVLLHDNLDVLKAAVANTETVTADGLKQFCAQLDDMKMLASAWFQAGMPAPVLSADAIAKLGNGATAPKRRRGRPSNAEIAARASVQ